LKIPAKLTEKSENLRIHTTYKPWKNLRQAIKIWGMQVFFFRHEKTFIGRAKYYTPLVTAQKTVFVALSDASKCVFEKCCSINFAK
jgi:hypothetical protein